MTRIASDSVALAADGIACVVYDDPAGQTIVQPRSPTAFDPRRPISGLAPAVAARQQCAQSGLPSLVWQRRGVLGTAHDPPRQEHDMNIKQHIEAGHYERGENAVIAVVRFAAPTGMGSAAHIVSTNGLGRYCLLGYYGHGHPYFAGSWDADGNCHSEESSTPRQCVLQPPPPRKVVESGFLVIAKNHKQYFDDRASAESYADNGDHAPDRIVQLTGEYEEPWT